MEELRFPIPPEILTMTVEATKLLMILLEAEAAALARLDSEEAKQLAQERLEDAQMAERLYNFYLDL